MEFVDTFTVIDMLGMFGRGGTPATAATRQGQPKDKQAPTTAPAASQPASGQVTSMLGLFKPKPPAPEGDDRPPRPAPSGAALCYRQFSNPSGLAGIRDQYDVSEFTCAASCQSLGESLYLTGETQVDDPPGMTCAEQCAYAAGSAFGAKFVRGRSINENRCVTVPDGLATACRRNPLLLRPLKDNKHQR